MQIFCSETREIEVASTFVHCHQGEDGLVAKTLDYKLKSPGFKPTVASEMDSFVFWGTLSFMS